MEWKPIAAGAVGFIALIGGDTWIMTRLLETYQQRQKSDMATMSRRLDLMVTKYVIPQTNEMAEIRAQLAVERVLRICAQRPEVCEDK